MTDKRVKNNLKTLVYRQKNAEKVVKTRRNNKLELIQYKGGKCEKCGYCKPIPSVYHFHHEDPLLKEFTVSRFISRSIKKLKIEVDKCKLLCANCHAEEHDRINLLNMEKTIRSMSELIKDELIERSEKIKQPQKTKECKFCKHSYLPNYKEQQFCSSDCRIKSRRKVERPPIEKLQEMIKTKSLSQIGKEYGVSSNSIKKWIRYESQRINRAS